MIQPVAEFTEPRAVPLFLAEGSDDRREPVPEVVFLSICYHTLSLQYLCHKDE